MNLNIKIGGDIGECGQPESAEPEGFSNLKKVNNILVYCGKERVPDVILKEELLMQSITELKDKIKKIIFEEDNFIQITKKEENISKKNPYKDNINILNSGREQFKNSLKQCENRIKEFNEIITLKQEEYNK
ncbi:hypothetical protein H8356DRAFT_1322107 [Neocallimastix lanati (nom. inval.)]|nr:hypothetical protein H8356DRAFT_1322107 [Neocallimastix sp. JGI-2020a]